MTSPYIATRVRPGIPIWDILAHGHDIGSATVFDYDGEGPMATVRYMSDKPITFHGASIRDVLAKVGTYLRAADADLLAQAEETAAEYYSEEIAPMEAAERDVEGAAFSMVGYDEPIW